jgi:hypothetical protein
VNDVSLQALDPFCHWLGATPLSQTLQSVDWIIPAVQTIHILAVAAVITAALMIDLRLLGVRGTDQPVASVTLRFMPLIWWPLPLLLLTGAVLIIAEPARALENPVFLLKMSLLLAAACVTLALQIPLRSDPAFWEASIGRKRTAQLIAVVSLPLWVAIICAGRWIAYVQGA